MHAPLSRPESSSIGADLRTRLEGAVERVEDGVTLLEAVVEALNRPALTSDDLATLSEVINQLPRLDEDADALGRHEEAAALVRTWRERKQWAADACHLALDGQEPASVRDGLERVLARGRLVRAPDREETRLREASGGRAKLPLVLAIGAALVGLAVEPWALAGAAVLLALYLFQAPRPAWTLLPDRLLIEPHAQRPFALEPSSLRQLQRTRDRLTLDGHELTGPEVPALHGLLTVLQSPWLAGLASRPRPHAIFELASDEQATRGSALLSDEGLLYVPTDKTDQVMACVARKAKISLRELLQLLAHLPSGRMNALGEALATDCAVRWLRRGSFSVVPSANAQLGATVQPHDEPHRALRLTFELARSEEQRALLARLQAT